MDRKAFFGRVDVAMVAGACAALLSLNCTPSASGLGNTGGSGAGGGGQGGSSSSGGNGGARTGAGGSNIDVQVAVNMDVQPLWWGPADAPQAPDTPPVPTADSNCGNITVRTTRQPVDVLLVLDRSGSMQYSIAQDCYCSQSAAGAGGQLCSDTSNCSPRWQTVSSALQSTLSSTPNIEWGLKLFATAGQGECTVSNGVEVQIGTGTADAIVSQINGTTPGNHTPTAAAVTAATAYLKALTDANQRIILLATDGDPNCANNGKSADTTDVTGTTSAITAAAQAGFQTYVIGIGPSVGNLDNFAQAGGTNNYYPATSPDDLTNALSSISKLVGSCTFTADKAPPDANNIAVYVNGQRVDQDPSNGWDFGSNPQEIVLTGDYCTQMSTGDQADVQILFGCPGAPPFPPKIY